MIDGPSAWRFRIGGYGTTN